MKVRIVNTGPDEASITDIKLTINVGDNHLSADLLKIPSDWRIRKRKTELMNLAYEDTPPEPPLLSTDSEPQSYRKGVARTGWVAFEVSSLRDIEFPNGEFVLLVKDSFAKMHVVTRKPMLYEKAGEIVHQSQHSLPPSP